MSIDPKLDPNRIVWHGMLLILVTFFGIGIWVALAPLHGAVIAKGEVRVDANRKTIQHFEGGIIKEIKIRDGDVVSARQTLLVLEDIRADATVQLIRQQLDAENAKIARLAAEKSHSGTIKFPEDLLARSNSDRTVAEVLHNEQAIFQIKRTALTDQINLIEKQIQESNAELTGLDDQISAENRALTITQEELDINQVLAEKKFVQNTRLLSLKRQLAQLEADRGEHIANQSRVRQNIINLELRVIDQKNQYRQKATDELEASSQKVQELLERLRPYEDAKTRLNIDTPVAGTIVNLRVHTVGGVIAPGEPILDIVPLNAPLIVEGKVAIENIDELILGMDADVHLVAYNHRTTPMAKGKVVYISADSLSTPEEKSPYFLVRVEIDQRSLDDIGGIKLAPGMPANLYIQTKARTALEYLLEPITDTLRKAFRES